MHRMSRLHSRGDGSFHDISRIESNGYNLDLQGKYIIIPHIDVSNVASFDVGTYSRLNNFEEGDDYVIQRQQRATRV